MDTQISIGQFEQVVLTAVLSLGDNAYGVTIHSTVEELSSPKKVALGAVYATLDRLEEKGLIKSWMTDPTPERGGRSKRHYGLEKAGERALKESVATARRIFDVVEHSWGEMIWSRTSKKSKSPRQR